MLRLLVSERAGWEDRVCANGLTYYLTDGKKYWNEGVCYQFTHEESARLRKATETLHEMCLQAVDRVVREGLYERFAIPAAFAPLVERSWKEGEPSVYGRYDLAFDGTQAPKMLEYNADTPTSLVEGAFAQKAWFDDMREEGGIPLGAEQFNDIETGIVKAWRRVHQRFPDFDRVHFACFYETSALALDKQEDYQNARLLASFCEQAGFTTKVIDIKSLAWDGDYFVSGGEKVHALFKLYPWEWLVREDLGEKLLEDATEMVEPAWKMVLSNKALLPTLWEMFPGHPNLLPAFFNESEIHGDYVRKPLFSREGANVVVKRGDEILSTGGPYGEDGFVYQSYTPIPSFGGNHPVIGSWVSSSLPPEGTGGLRALYGGEACGIGIREDDSVVTRNTSRFAPHFVA